MVGAAAILMHGMIPAMSGENLDLRNGSNKQNYGASAFIPISDGNPVFSISGYELFPELCR